MIATAIGLSVLGLAITADYDKDVDIGLGAPLMVDMVAWYVAGAYLGVFPTLA